MIPWIFFRPGALATETVLLQRIEELEKALLLAERSNGNLVRQNQILSDLAANKTAYAEQLRQALNRARSRCSICNQNGHEAVNCPDKLHAQLDSSRQTTSDALLAEAKKRYAPNGFCDGCRYLTSEKVAEGTKHVCSVFGWHLKVLVQGPPRENQPFRVATHPECAHGPYWPRPICRICGDTDHETQRCPHLD